MSAEPTRAAEEIVAQAWIAGSRRAPERESYFDPAPLVAAIATRPRAWPRYLRLQARRLVDRLAKADPR